MANSLDPKGQAFLEILSEGLCYDCYVLTGRVSIKLENGKEAGPTDGIYLHHVVTSDMTKNQDLPVNKCATAGKNMPPLGAEFLAQGDDNLGSANKFTSLDGTANTGFYLSKDAKVMSNIDIVHYNEQNRTVYLGVELEYVPAQAGMRDAAAVLMSVTGCPAERLEYGSKNGISIKLNPDGPAVTDGYKYPVLKDTTIVASSGMYLSLLRTRTQACRLTHVQVTSMMAERQWS